MQLTATQRAAMRHREANDCSLVMLPNPPFWNNKNKTDEEKAEIKERAQTLQAGIRLDYDAKVVHAEKVIRMALDLDINGTPMNPPGPTDGVRWAVSYSGGKDSTVLSHLMVFGMGIKLPHVMSNTRMEYPETLKQVTKWYALLREWGVECHTAYPDAKPKDLWKQIGVPLWGKEVAYKYRKFLASPKSIMNGAVPDHLRASFEKAKEAGLKITDQCCDELKKKPMKKWAKTHGITGQFTGVRCSESRMRRMTWIRMGSMYESTYHGRLWIANPLAFWTQEDVERYLDDNDIRPIRIPTVRGGSGCVTCMFGCHLVEKGKPNALQELAVLNPKMHKAALDDWGYRPVLDLLGIPYEKISENPVDTFRDSSNQGIANPQTPRIMIEEAIAKLTAAVESNTAVLVQILASSGSAPAAEPQPEAAKPAKEKKSKPAVEVKTKLEVVEPEAPEEEESDAPEEKTYTITEALEASKKVLAADRDKNKPLLAAIREKFGVETVKDLKEEQLGPYMAELAKLEA